MAVILLSLFSGITQAQNKAKNSVQLVRKDGEKKVEVLIDGKLFTSYYYPESLAKPVLYPIISAGGHEITRGYPLAPRAGERVDHPHHVGHWMNYGDVNGLDFWNNSDAIPADQKSKYGTIVHTGILEAKETPKGAELEIGMDWVRPDGKILLKEKTRFVFSSEGEKRSITRITTLTAQDLSVSMKDNKEGVFAIRVARELEHPSNKPEIFTDANGIPTTVASLNNEGVSGKYRSSAGKEGDEVWGTRGTWVTLNGQIGSETITVAIVDHPSNPGYPTYWHARGYGLFSANPLGQKELSGGKDVLDFKLQPGESVTFKYEILVISGYQPNDQEMNKEALKFGNWR
ncbi:methane monooxygenase PmoA-like [Algoriphagus boseongensis]|uniref:Methane monooxygenase PmoA-like n=1 Tax=Algoriphagus boseongensis TaxID=1442587 RepID=A0A4R6T9Q9_9BACT|nr:PmoA family protein [Algoriphagus boseongensis]TDQ19511.1 methane monooxygenase PmoA-like [Algoriphagus boseongensis]